MKHILITTIAAVLLASCGKPGDILAVSAIGDINAVKRDLLKSTLVVYMGDNGFQFGEQGLIDKRTAYEASMRIPFLMHCPDVIQAGSVIRKVVANIDVGATLLETAGLSTPKQMDGRSFWQLAKGNDISWRDYVLYEYFWERNYPHTMTTHAVRGERFKYIRYHGLWDTDELYDLLNDPDETTNLIFEPEHKETVALLNKRLFEFLAESGGGEFALGSGPWANVSQTASAALRGGGFSKTILRHARII
jgi:N-acetylglucosamine-6-sulfatase